MPRYISPGDIRQVLRVQILRCRHDARRRTAERASQRCEATWQRTTWASNRKPVVDDMFILVDESALLILYDWHAQVMNISSKLQRESQLLQELCPSTHWFFIGIWTIPWMVNLDLRSLRSSTTTTTTTTSSSSSSSSTFSLNSPPCFVF